jgi:arsenate reductase
VQAEYRDYLEQAPSVAELEQLLQLLGTEDALAIMRPKEAAIAATPSLLERPILVLGDRAIVERPPERALEIL